ncbi:TPA: Tc toxin subunit A, partial [Morganella morganii]
LAKLVLSQENLDKEITTLSLANEQLETALMAQAGQTDKNKYYETLATSRRSGVTPYNAPFEGIRNALAQQDFVLPDHVLSEGAESAAQMALYAGISPELYAILTEKTDGLSEAATEALLKKNFPGVNTDNLMNPDALANYYELPRDEVQALLEITIPYGSSLKETHNLYGKNKTQIIKARNTDGDVFYTLTHTRLKNEAVSRVNFEYIDLIPLDNNQFYINFRISYLDSEASGLYIGVVTPYSNYPENIYSSATTKPEKGKHYSIQGTIPAAKVTPEITISVYTRLSYNWYGHSTFAVTKTTTVPLPLLLTLNKILRLAKATGMTPPETQRALTRLNTTGKLSDATVLHRFCEFLLYRKRYNISTDDALILSGANISTVSYDGQLSQFDRMFNNPPLNGEVYSLGGDPLDLESAKDDKRLKNVYRALQITRPELSDLFWVLEGMVISNSKIDNTLQRISKLYLAKLLAVTNGITIHQLYNIYLCSPYNRTKIKDASDTERRNVINYLWQTTQWLNRQNVTADTLFILQALGAPDIPTGEMNILLNALRNGGIDNKNTDTLRATMAPVIAAAMQLENPEQGEAVLRWLDNNHPNKVPLTTDFWVMLINNKTPDLQAKWCQALAQRVLVIRTFALSNAELQILSQGAPAGTIAALREISDFHDL